MATGSAITTWKPRNDDTEQRLLWKIATYLATGLGLGGVLSGLGSPQTGRFAIFHALSDSIVTVRYSDGTFATRTLVAGDRIYGDFVEITQNSGTGEIYKAIV